MCLSNCLLAGYRFLTFAVYWKVKIMVIGVRNRYAPGILRE